jgi:hypothetical protein
MTSPALNIQDPGDTQGYSVDYTALLNPGESITAAPWTITPTGPTISDQALVGEPATGASCELAGVALAGVYRLICTATTSAGRVLVQSLVVRGFPQ